MHKQKGIALFQVILITTILIILATYISNKANKQVSSAEQIKDKQLAMLATRSILSQIKFNLLTTTADILVDKQGWNFYGEEFLIDDVTVSIQDHNGLLSLNKNTPIETFKSIITTVENETNTSISVSANIFKEWFSNPAHNRIQNLEQLMNIGFSYEAAASVWHKISVNSRFVYNPMNVPTASLNVLYDKNIAQEIDQLRSNRLAYSELIERLKQVTGIQNGEDQAYITGPYYRIKINAKIGESHWKMLYELSMENGFNGMNLINLSQRPF